MCTRAQIVEISEKKDRRKRAIEGILKGWKPSLIWVISNYPLLSEEDGLTSVTGAVWGSLEGSGDLTSSEAIKPRSSSLLLCSGSLSAWRNSDGELLKEARMWDGRLSKYSVARATAFWAVWKSLTLEKSPNWMGRFGVKDQSKSLSQHISEECYQSSSHLEMLLSHRRFCKNDAFSSSVCVINFELHISSI